MAEKFEEVCAKVKALPKDDPNPMSDNEKLKMYAWFKQATVGNVNTSRPGMMDFTGKAKWDAWKAIENMSKDEAKKNYVEFIESKGIIKMTEIHQKMENSENQELKIISQETVAQKSQENKSQKNISPIVKLFSNKIISQV